MKPNEYSGFVAGPKYISHDMFETAHLEGDRSCMICESEKWCPKRRPTYVVHKIDANRMTLRPWTEADGVE